MGIDKIVIKGAREHNLKNVDLTLPRDKFIVMTGLSGSGKSSLAFDTIYADGQRRYVESLSSYARQFLGQMEKPDVDYIEGLSPAISIDQKTTSKNPRSTVGTVTEIYDYLRLLYARIGTPHCTECGVPIKQQTIDQIVDKVLELEDKTKIMVLAPIVVARKGEHLKEFESAKKAGFVRVIVDGILYDLSEEIKLEKNKKHTIEIVVDRLVMNDSIKSRITDSIETAVNITGGFAVVEIIDGERINLSQNFACPIHNVSMPDLEPSMFSFNNPSGACPKCTGLGTFLKVDPDMIVPNPKLSIKEGCIKASGWYLGEPSSITYMYLDGLSKKYKFSLDTPFNKLSTKIKNIIFYGTDGAKIKVTRKTEFTQGEYEVEFEGIVNNLERRFRETQSNYIKDEITQVMSEEKCPECYGERLKKEILSVTVGDINISNFTKMSVNDALEFINNIKFSNREMIIASQIVKEIKERLNFLVSVGLDYLTLSRASGTLSGGESQRIRLATQIGSSLVGVLYILDEPSIGLHQKDNNKLLATLNRLRDLGNTLIVVEHDEDTMRAADYIVDIGPGAGIHGGNIVASGSLNDIIENENSITGAYLSKKLTIPVPTIRRAGNGNFLTVIGAKENNLKDIDVSIPLGTFCAVTGVSGSGKSSLVNQIIYKQLAKDINGSRAKAGIHKKITGTEFIDKIIDIDQSPIGRTPRSNPATYTGVFTDIREIFAMTNDAKMKGYTSGRFSFNVKGGRCEACSGDGIIKIEMHFLPDVFVPCEVCHSKRYNRETLEIKYKGKSIHDVLDMTIEEATAFFEPIPKIFRKLNTLLEVGLGYVKLGQSATTLSGGEAQRVKLATELSKRSTGNTMYILDEPTTGLHTADVHKLIEMLDKLVLAGNTVLVIEHNLDVIKTADYVIDLGPDGGIRGGIVIAKGTPEEVAKCKESYTGEYLKTYLE